MAMMILNMVHMDLYVSFSTLFFLPFIEMQGIVQAVLPGSPLRLNPTPPNKETQGLPLSPPGGEEEGPILLLIRDTLRGFFSRHPTIGVLGILGLIGMVVNRLFFALRLLGATGHLLGLGLRLLLRFMIGCSLLSAGLLAVATHRKGIIARLGKLTRFGELHIDANVSIFQRGAEKLDIILHRLGNKMETGMKTDNDSTISGVGITIAKCLSEIKLSENFKIVNDIITIHGEATREVYWASLINAFRRTEEVLNVIMGPREHKLSWPALWLAARTEYVIGRITLALCSAMFSGAGDKRIIAEFIRVIFLGFLLAPYSFHSGSLLETFLFIISIGRLVVGLPSFALAFSTFVWKPLRMKAHKQPGREAH